MNYSDADITKMTEAWYKYVSLDSHKDRDCHFYIEKIWSYGNTPKYLAYHEGYVAERWTGPTCSSAQGAQNTLGNFLLREIKGAIEWAQSPLAEDEDAYWSVDRESVLEIFKEWS